MKKTYLISAILIIALIFAGTFMWLDFKENSGAVDSITQECFNQGDYCVYDKIPSYLKYSEPSQFYIDDASTIIFKNNEPTGEIIEEFTGNLSDYLIKSEDSISRNYETYKCASTNQKPIVIEYFYDLCEDSQGMVGCGHERKAIICGNIYFVEDFTSSYGPRFYGPFSIEN